MRAWVHRLCFDTCRMALLVSIVQGRNPAWEAGTKGAAEVRGAEMVGRVVALVALVAVLVAVVLVVSGGGGGGDYEVTAEFTNASQLVKGNEVTIGGTRAGSVESIELGAERQRARLVLGRRGVHAASRRHDRPGPLLLALGRCEPPDPADAAPRRSGRRPDRGRRHDGPHPDDLGGGPRRDLQHAGPGDGQRLQEGHQGLLDHRRRRRRPAGEQGLPVPQPVPVDLASHLRRAHARHPGARAAHRQRREALEDRRPAAAPTSRPSSGTSTR